MKNKKISLVLSVGVLVFAFAFFASQVSGQSWTPPTLQFPAGNTSAPLDVSTKAQTKNADLGADSFISNVTGVVPAFVMPPRSFIGTEVNGGGNNKIFLAAGNNMIFTAAGGFLVSVEGGFSVNARGGPASFSYSKGLALPNYSTTSLGTGVQEGTLTYNNGKLYLFVPGGISGGQTKNTLLNEANAQTFNGRWAEVGGGGGTIINNYSSTSVAGVWFPGRGGVYTTTTVVSVGPNGGTNLKMEVGANAINFKAVTGGANQGNNGIVNKAVAQSEPLIFSIAPGTGAVSVPQPFTVQSTLTAQNTLTANGVITAKSAITVAPNGVTAYSIKNDGGTLGLYAGNNPGANLTLGQDGVLGVKGKIIYLGDKLSVVGNYSNGTAVYNTNWGESPPSQVPSTQCPCDTTLDWMDCEIGSTAPANLVGQQCYDRIEMEANYRIPGRKLILFVTGSGRAILQVGGNLGSTFKVGAIRLATTDTEGPLLYGNPGGIFTIGAHNTTNEVSINPSSPSLFQSNGISTCTVGPKFLTLDVNGNLMCQAVTVPLTTQNIGEFIAHSAGGTVTTDMGTTNNGTRFCFLTKYGVSPNSDGECRIELENNDQWKLRAQLGSGQNIQCRARCIINKS